MRNGLFALSRALLPQLSPSVSSASSSGTIFRQGVWGLVAVSVAVASAVSSSPGEPLKTDSAYD